MNASSSLFCFAIASFLATTSPALAQTAAGQTTSAATAPELRHVPTQAPRTGVLAGRHDAFRTYVLSGAGAAAFTKLKSDFDKTYLALPFPKEPLTYGDPSPRKRDSDKADLWRQAQDVCGVVSGVAEAATYLWMVTGEARYLEKAKHFLLSSCAWSLDPSGWRNGPSTGATDVTYNDEAHFRLWRKLPLVFDQIRDQLTPDERATVLAHFRQRGTRSVEWIEHEGKISTAVRNSLAVTPSSHPIRFMPMTALTALALWDDLPEARDWWTSAYSFYRDRFPPWGGDQGGWAEGPAYWRGNMEHAVFQDALLAIGDPSAYQSLFWKNHGYFQVYNVQPYLASGFGDFSNAGKFNLEPVVAEYLTHVARVTQDGYLLSYARLCTDKRPSPAERGLAGLDRIYPTSAEFLVRNFIASALPLPRTKPLSDLPRERYFSDIGWVSLHSALGRPDSDIHVSFVSSPYGSFSHSHAHQNAFVLNAYGENLAIASGYREFHNSPHHDQWTRQTKSKNAVLIDGIGQKPQDKNARGSITRYQTGERFVLTTGDATPAYALAQPKGQVKRVTRDLLFVDHRYVVIRDVVTLEKAGRLSWLLHAEDALDWNASRQTAVIRAAKATLTARLVSPQGDAWTGTITDTFTTPVDPKYSQGNAAASYASAQKWGEQKHFSADSPKAAKEHILYAVLWPDPGTPARPLDAVWKNGGLVITRPDGRTDTVKISDQAVSVQ